jgi:hypothetical protein
MAKYYRGVILSEAKNLPASTSFSAAPAKKILRLAALAQDDTGGGYALAQDDTGGGYALVQDDIRGMTSFWDGEILQRCHSERSEESSSSTSFSAAPAKKILRLAARAQDDTGRGYALVQDDIRGMTSFWDGETLQRCHSEHGEESSFVYRRSLLRRLRRSFDSLRALRMTPGEDMRSLRMTQGEDVRSLRMTYVGCACSGCQTG